MSGTILSIIPPLLVLLFVLLTKRVLTSISIGILSSALLLHQFNLMDTFQSILKSVIGIFYSDGAWNLSSMYLISFLFLLGIITAFISSSNGTHAFANWAMSRIKNPRAAQLLAFALGIIIFIDDYFNALTVGQVSRPLTDRYGVSRAKLAYIIDSTSAPICVMSPISSWGAYIIGIIGAIFATYQITEISSFTGFMKMIPLNFYAILSLVMVVAAILFNINIGPMKKFELNVEPQSPTSPSKKISGTPYDLLFPILTLVAVTVFSMTITGAMGGDWSFNIFSILENTNANLSLFLGALAGLAVAYTRLRTKKVEESVTSISKKGFMSMASSVAILLFAWTLTDLIGQIGTGEYLSGLLEAWNVKGEFLPLLLFALAGIMAFTTGTSWGTFSLMLPIGAQMVMTSEPTLLLPALAAVLAGAVFGDHCSPISDTTILSATGAKCDHVMHVTTQLPFALSVAGVSAVGYILIGFTGSVLLAFSASILILIVLITIVHFKNNAQQSTAV